ncbi:tetratricopeptide repeat protein [Rhizobium sp. CG5]|uniref:tetratricopeptide repeat-containing sulfotransferase family protein n=1 Tax=Rhizobium sp. CG5 TaxID=2726076 RepID=UPI0020344462|nr:tetratricopeptide repeat-containing sulfotransferase family protein [Rhizobium sp. CG5]MCM2476501.1 tetratricopeptide repeat protein [Rhizobium sp. CG5]
MTSAAQVASPPRQALEQVVDKGRAALLRLPPQLRQSPEDPVRRLRDHTIKAMLDLSRLLQQSGDMDGSRALLTDALALDPRKPAIQVAIGRLEALRQRPDLACTAFSAALRLNADDCEVWSMFGDSLVRIGKLADAAAAYDAALRLDPHHLATLNNYSSLACSLSDYQKALDLLLRGHAAAPASREILLNLHNVSEYLGREDLSRHYLEQLIAISPGDSDAHLRLSALTRYEDGHPHIATMEALYRDSPVGSNDRVNLGHALFKAYHATGRSREAFAALRQANDLRRAALSYSHQAISDYYTALRQFFDTDFRDRTRSAGYAGKSPIFIVGMPRSGSTLTERILASHPDVTGVGEIGTLVGLAQRRIMADRSGVRLPDAGLITPDALHTLGRDYCRSLETLAAGAPRTVDKQLFNFAWIGLIKAVLPAAKIIDCRRSPLANGLACYSSFLAEPGLEFTCDLEDLGHFFVDYRAMMDHWHRLFPGEILELSYEQLTTDQEAETRRLLDYCDLSWDEACLDFHKSDGAVRTMSAMQVRQPMYSGVDKKTARYLDELAPLIAILTEAGLMPAPAPAA